MTANRRFQEAFVAPRRHLYEGWRDGTLGMKGR
jgi:hypothetical protein